jgi:hypothetical protein
VKGCVNFECVLKPVFWQLSDDTVARLNADMSSSEKKFLTHCTLRDYVTGRARVCLNGWSPVAGVAWIQARARKHAVRVRRAGQDYSSNPSPCECINFSGVLWFYVKPAAAESHAAMRRVERVWAPVGYQD